MVRSFPVVDGVEIIIGSGGVGRCTVHRPAGQDSRPHTLLSTPLHPPQHEELQTVTAPVDRADLRTAGGAPQGGVGGS
jgi:hypothetical protein